MESYKEDNTLLDEKSKKILEEIKDETVSMSDEMRTLFIKDMKCDITEELANIWGKKLAYQGKYINLLTEKLH